MARRRPHDDDLTVFRARIEGALLPVSVVVERGLARCPRCVAVADYTFVESGPNSMRYEVHCGRCGEDYCEVHAPMAPGFTAAVEALAFQPLVVPTSAFAARRRRAGAWFSRLWHRARNTVQALHFRR